MSVPKSETDGRVDISVIRRRTR